ncbi:LOW QUALITY PROTEIN: Transposase [Phytophthora megakarya]|uniref:Transposase n=1 Tax=Phytophthora megakarya TaxID=4795 RepID=A0A225VZM1_9STRA|nr:LOW QUALITY PROTEIN: Transposase [Phytophthora megakarya]
MPSPPPPAKLDGTNVKQPKSALSVPFVKVEVAANNEVNYWTARRCILRAESTGDEVSAGGVRDSRVQMSVDVMAKIDKVEVAANNEVNYSTARRCILRAESTGYEVSAGGVRDSRFKMSVDVMAKIEEYLDEDCCHTCQQMADRLRNDLGVLVSKPSVHRVLQGMIYSVTKLKIEKVTMNNTKWLTAFVMTLGFWLSSVHRALQGMIYSVKKLKIEKVTMNNITNKAKRKEFVEALNKHVKNGDMIIYQDETNFNMYLSRGEGWARVGERAAVALPPSQGTNSRVQGGVSPEAGIVLMRTHEGSIRKEENAKFVADLFVAAQGTDEYHELDSSNKVVVVTDNAPAHSQVEALVRDMLVADGIVNGSKLVLLRLAPYSPMLNRIEGCWNVLKTRMKRFVAERKEELLRIRHIYCAIMKEAVAIAKPAIERRMVSRMERHCLVPATLPNTERI